MTSFVIFSEKYELSDKNVRLSKWMFMWIDIQVKKGEYSEKITNISDRFLRFIARMNSSQVLKVFVIKVFVIKVFVSVDLNPI